MSGDHGYDPFGLGKPFPAMEAAVAEITELQEGLARLRAENERLRRILAVAAAHTLELRVAWECGAIRETDNLGGIRSNRNADVGAEIRAVLKEPPCP